MLKIDKNKVLLIRRKKLFLLNVFVLEKCSLMIMKILDKVNDRRNFVRYY